MKKQLICICMAALLSLNLLTGCGAGTDTGDTAGTETKNVTVRLSEVTHSVFYAPQYVAMSQGFFADEGLDIELSNGGGADKVMTAVVSGGADIGLAGPESCIYIHAQGKDDLPVIFAQLTKRDGSFLVGRSDEAFDWNDLKGKTIVAAGKGSTPEYALRYLLTENGIDPDNDVTIDWKSEHSECVAALASGQASVALLPQPFVTVAQSKIEGLRMALDLNAEWDALDNGSALITGVIVARRAVVEENPAAVEAFLKDYAASVDWVNANTADAAALIGEYGIVDAAVAEKALPYCNIVCLTGADLLEALPGYLEVLYNASPAAVGGEMPDNSFYFA